MQNILLIQTLFTVFSFIMAEVSLQNGSGPVVKTNGGTLVGKLSQSRNGKFFHEFLGVPYGNIPARFRISESTSWTGVRNATKYGANCMQIDSFTQEVTGEEDCLFLNVFTPMQTFQTSSNSTRDKLPVIFAIHGGSFSSGSGSELSGNFFMDHEVVVVTANYRLGVLGFLNTETAAARGNQGLKDLVLALQWVKANIGEFGGDCSRIILNGVSDAGAYAASTLILSPMAKGLFSGAISQGSSALCPWTGQFTPGQALKNAKLLANQIDCPTSDNWYLTKCLERLQPQFLLQATLDSPFDFFDGKGPTFGPSLETVKSLYSDSDPDIFLSKSPLELLLEGEFTNVPYIMGTNSNEGLLNYGSVVLLNDNLTERINAEWGRVAPVTFLYEDSTRDPCVVSGKVRSFYFDDKPISNSSLKDLSHAYGDRWTYQCSRNMALLYSKHAPTYMYTFTQEGMFTFVDFLDSETSKDKGIKSKPPTHGHDVRYLYPNDRLEYLPNIHPNSTEYEFSENFLDLWSSFARDGKPSCNWCVGESSKWRPLRSEDRPVQFFQIDSKNPGTREEAFEFTNRMEFWNNLNLKDQPEYEIIKKVLAKPVEPTSIQPNLLGELAKDETTSKIQKIQQHLLLTSVESSEMQEPELNRPPNVSGPKTLETPAENILMVKQSVKTSEDSKIEKPQKNLAAPRKSKELDAPQIKTSEPSFKALNDEISDQTASINSSATVYSEDVTIGIQKDGNASALGSSLTKPYPPTRSANSSEIKSSVPEPFEFRANVMESNETVLSNGTLNILSRFTFHGSLLLSLILPEGLIIANQTGSPS